MMAADQNILWKSLAEDFPLDNEPAYRGEPHSLPIPNGAMRESSSVADLGAWYAIGEAWAHVVNRFLPSQAVVLDLGCGCGKLARFLYLNKDVRYVGIDIFLPAILWCRKSFELLAGDRFRFEHFDGISKTYNPRGTIRPSDYVLPLPDGSVDMTVCASLFTHLLEPDLIHYLDEIRRVSAVGGRALVSIHNEPPPGRRIAGDESRIDLDEGYFTEIAARSGLHLRETIGNVYGQQVLLLERTS